MAVSSADGWRRTSTGRHRTVGQIGLNVNLPLAGPGCSAVTQGRRHSWKTSLASMGSSQLLGPVAWSSQDLGSTTSTNNPPGSLETTARDASAVGRSVPLRAGAERRSRVHPSPFSYADGGPRCPPSSSRRSGLGTATPLVGPRATPSPPCMRLSEALSGSGLHRIRQGRPDAVPSWATIASTTTRRLFAGKISASMPRRRYPASASVVGQPPSPAASAMSASIGMRRGMKQAP